MIRRWRVHGTGKDAPTAGAMVPHSSGFTLLEVIVALALFASAIASVAQLFTVSARATRQARVGGTAATLAAQKMEQLRGLAWGYGAAGEVCSDTSTDLAVQPEAAGGQGLSRSPESALVSNVPGFVEFLDERGEWVGTGTTPPPRAAFVRRWAIAPLEGDPSDALVLRVVVAGLEARADRAGEAGGVATTELTTVRSRRGR